MLHLLNDERIALLADQLLKVHGCSRRLHSLSAIKLSRQVPWRDGLICVKARASPLEDISCLVQRALLNQIEVVVRHLDRSLSVSLPQRVAVLYIVQVDRLGQHGSSELILFLLRYMLALWHFAKWILIDIVVAVVVVLVCLVHFGEQLVQVARVCRVEGVARLWWGHTRPRTLIRE